MRIYFPSQKRVSNIARRIRLGLGADGIVRSDTQVREAVSVASGYRNHNELLRTIFTDGSASPADEDMPPDEAYERSRSFIERLSVALDVDQGRLSEIYEEISPFSGASFAPRMTAGQVEQVAANLTRAATEISPLVPDTSRKGDWLGFEVKLGRKSYRLGVSEPGEIWQGDEETLAKLLWAGGIARVTERADGRAWPSNVHVLAVLKRLDRKALFVLRGVELYKEPSYLFARAIPDGSAWLRSLAAYPRLGRALAGTIDRRREYEIDLADPAPMRNVVGEVLEVSREKWPNSIVTSERATLVTRRYMAVSTGSDGYVPLVPAFLMHLPDDVQPKSASDYEKVEEFLFRSSSVFEAYSLGLQPASFGEAMREAYGSDWGKVDNKPRHLAMTGAYLGAAVVAKAAREAGYGTALSADFEQPEEERCADMLFHLGSTLIAERNLNYRDGIELLDKMHARTDKRLDEHVAGEKAGLPTLDEDDVGEDDSYYAFLTENVLHSRHRGRRALDILGDHGIDVHEIVADAADYGSPLYEARKEKGIPLEDASPVSAGSSGGDRTTAAAGHRLHITVNWNDPRMKTNGSSSIAVTLLKPLDEIIKVSRYRYSSALCEFSRLGPGRLHTEQSLEYEQDPVEMACAAARELQFMSATDLVPAKRDAHLGQFGDKFPDLDHWTTWTDKETGATVVTSEYNADDDGSRYAQWADRNDNVVIISKWGGMYKPRFCKLILISEIRNEAMLRGMEFNLAALEAPIVRGNCKLVGGWEG